MPPWIYVWILRYALGERMEKTQPKDYRHWFGIFALFPVWIVTFAQNPIGRDILDKGSMLAVWAYGVVFMITLILTQILWGRWVKARVSLILAVVTWPTVFWFFFRKG